MSVPLLGSFELYSPLARDVCAGRIAAMTRYRSSPLVGWADRDRFRVCQRTAGFRNSFRPHLSGRMRDDGSGTRMRCRFGLHPFVLAFCCAWVSIAVAAQLIAPHMPIALPFLAVFALIAGGGYAMSFPERDLILDQLRYSVDTHPV